MKKIYIAISVIVLGFMVTEGFLMYSRGKGFLGKVNTRPPYYNAYVTLGKISEYCSKYSISHHWKLPPPQEIAQNVPDVRLSESQPYLRYGIYVFESTLAKEKYLYQPLSEEMLSKDDSLTNFVCASVVPYGKNKQGKYVPYKRGDETLPYAVVIKSETTWGSLILTQGVPPIPGCLIRQQSGKDDLFIIPRNIVDALKSCYPDVTISPELIQEER